MRKTSIIISLCLVTLGAFFAGRFSVSRIRVAPARIKEVYITNQQALCKKLGGNMVYFANNPYADYGSTEITKWKCISPQVDLTDKLTQ